MENGVMIARFWEKPKEVWVQEQADGKMLLEMFDGDGQLQECVKFGSRDEIQGFLNEKIQKALDNKDTFEV